MMEGNEQFAKRILDLGVAEADRLLKRYASGPMDCDQATEAIALFTFIAARLIAVANTLDTALQTNEGGGDEDRRRAWEALFDRFLEESFDLMRSESIRRDG